MTDDFVAKPSHPGALVPHQGDKMVADPRQYVEQILEWGKRVAGQPIRLGSDGQPIWSAMNNDDEFPVVSPERTR